MLKSPPTRSRLVLAFLLTGTLGVAVGCKKNVTAPPVAGLALTPVEKTQAQLILTATLSSLDRSVTRAAALAETMQLPVTGTQLRPMLLGKLQIPPAVTDHLALDKPFGFAVVARTKPGADPHFALAVHAKSEAAGRKVLDALGTRSGGQKDAVKVTRKEGGDLWVLSRKDTVIASLSLEDLVAAGAQASRALSPSKEDLNVQVQVDNAIRASGKDIMAELKTARDRAMKESAQSQNAAMNKYLARTMDMYMGWLSDMKALDLALSLIPEDGLRVRGTVHSRKDSGLAKQFGATQVATLDPAFQGGPAPAALMATGANPALMDLYVGMIEAMVDVPGAAGSVAGVRKLLAMMQGSGSARVEIADDKLVYSTATPINKGVENEAVMLTLDELFKSDGLPALIAALDKQTGTRLDWQRKGNTGRFSIAHEKGPQAQQMRAAVKSLLGSETLTLAVTANGGRVLATTEPGAEARLAAMAKPGSTVAPEVKQLLDETRGDAGFGYLDLLAIARPIINVAATQDPSARQAAVMLKMLPGLATLRVPLIGRFRGGDALTAELFIPRRTFAGVGAVVGPLRGLMGGAMGGPPGGDGVLTPGQ